MRWGLSFLLLLLGCGIVPPDVERACLDRDDDKVSKCMAGCTSAPGIGAFAKGASAEKCVARCGNMFCLRSALKTRAGVWCASAKEPSDVEGCRRAEENKP